MTVDSMIRPQQVPEVTGELSGPVPHVARRLRRRRRAFGTLAGGAAAMTTTGAAAGSVPVLVVGVLCAALLAVYVLQLHRLRRRSQEPGLLAAALPGWSEDDLAAWMPAAAAGAVTMDPPGTLDALRVSAPAGTARSRRHLLDRWTVTQVLWAGVAGAAYNGLLGLASYLAAGSSSGWLRRHLLALTTALIAYLGRRSVRTVALTALATASTTGFVAATAGAASTASVTASVQTVAARATLDDAVVTTPTPAPSATYRVQPGDTLSAIAARFGTTVGAIAGANGIADPNLIDAGQVLTIPSGTAAVAAASAVSTPAPAAPSATPATYRVQPGDTLSAIAARFGTTVGAIAGANGIADPNLIDAGQVLTIPSGTAAVAAASAAPAATPTTYRVQPGDTLSAIAARFGTTVGAIAGANGIADPNLIDAGQVLTIPSGTAAVAAASAVSTPAPPPSAPAPPSAPPSAGTGYGNPLRAVSNLSPERIDQGVDYGGSGPVYAIGDGTVLNTTNAGWPGGAFITYRLSGGPAAGDIVYVAENVVPRVQVGQQVTPTTVVGTLVGGPPGLETGWAQPPGDGNAAATGQWNTSTSTAYGENFSQLLQTLGAPGGATEGSVRGSLPAGWPSW